MLGLVTWPFALIRLGLLLTILSMRWLVWLIGLAFRSWPKRIGRWPIMPLSWVVGGWLTGAFLVGEGEVGLLGAAILWAATLVRRK